MTLDRPRVPRASVAGFDGVRRAWSAEYQRYAAQIMPGEFYVTQEDELIVTLLGSCVAACVRDRRSGYGGMNHFMLPEGSDGASTAWIERASTRYGDFAMEQLINELLKLGARREDLEVKLAGGGRMYESNANIGAENAQFAVRYLREEGLHLAAHDLGGAWPRKVRYLPREGSMRVSRLPPIVRNRIVVRETSYRESIERKSDSGQVTFL